MRGRTSYKKARGKAAKNVHLHVCKVKSKAAKKASDSRNVIDGGIEIDSDGIEK